MKKLILTITFFSSLTLSAQERELNNLGISEDTTFRIHGFETYIDSLDIIINSTEEFIYSNEDKVELMAIIEDSNKPIPLPNREWPDNVSTSINMLRNDKNEITYYAEYPTSESGDWSIGYQYLINGASKKVISFRRIANFFNSECASGVVKEQSTYYFSTNQKLIGKSYSLLNQENKDLTHELCFFSYDYEYQIAKNLSSLVKNLNIKISK